MTWIVRLAGAASRSLVLSAVALVVALGGPSSTAPLPTPARVASPVPVSGTLFIQIATPAPSAGLSVVQDYGGSFEFTETVAQAQAWAKSVLSANDYKCLYWLLWNESRWKPDAVNSYGGACGLGQAWPCSKLSSIVPNWRTEPIEQLSLFVLPYIAARYRTPCVAWSWWLAHKWY